MKLEGRVRAHDAVHSIEAEGGSYESAKVALEEQVDDGERQLSIRRVD